MPKLQLEGCGYTPRRDHETVAMLLSKGYIAAFMYHQSVMSSGTLGHLTDLDGLTSQSTHSILAYCGIRLYQPEPGCDKAYYFEKVPFPDLHRTTA